MNTTTPDVPEYLIREMQGLADGARSVNPNTPSTFDRIIALNFGIDFIIAHAYSGTLRDRLHDTANKLAVAQTWSTHVLSDVHAVISSARSPFHTMLGCNFIGVSGKATADGQSAYFGRDFMFPTAFVFQRTQSPIIYNPTDGHRPMVASSTPGFVGCVTGMNSVGVAMSVDVLQTSLANADRPGMNALLMVRHVVSTAADAQEAFDTVVDTQRGSSWIYNMCDGNGTCMVFETGAMAPDGPTPSNLDLIKDNALLRLLPSEAVLAASGPTQYRKGVYMRDMTFRVSPDVLAANQGLYEYYRLPYNASSFADPAGFVYQSWEEDDAVSPVIGTSFFAPERFIASDAIVATNHAVVPQTRISMMSAEAQLLDQLGKINTHWR